MILDNQEMTTDEVGHHHLHFSHGSAHGMTQDRLWFCKDCKMGAETTHKREQLQPFANLPRPSELLL
jgi:hypothetical protein